MKAEFSFVHLFKKYSDSESFRQQVPDSVAAVGDTVLRKLLSFLAWDSCAGDGDMLSNSLHFFNRVVVSDTKKHRLQRACARPDLVWA